MGSHELCSRVYNFGSDYALPSRLIDVGPADGSEAPRLAIPEHGEDAAQLFRNAHDDTKFS
jgi:hypothetical protein